MVSVSEVTVLTLLSQLGMLSYRACKVLCDVKWLAWEGSWRGSGLYRWDAGHVDARRL
jgi:hypothetical protein